jgi:hypothetical protein
MFFKGPSSEAGKMSYKGRLKNYYQINFNCSRNLQLLLLNVMLSCVLEFLSSLAVAMQ